MLDNFYVYDHIKEALKEDIGFGDITTDCLAGENDLIKKNPHSMNVVQCL